MWEVEPKQLQANREVDGGRGKMKQEKLGMAKVSSKLSVEVMLQQEWESLLCCEKSSCNNYWRN